MASPYTGSYTGIVKGEKAEAAKMTAALNLLERVANKTDTVTADSTAAQYPSAAAAYTAIAAMSGAGLEITSNKTGTISASSTDTQYPTAKAVHTALGDKEDVANKVTAATWEVNKDNDVKYPTCNAVNALGIDKIESASNKTGTISASSTDTQYPTALAVHNALTPKEDAANKVTAATWEANKDSDVRYPTCKAVNALGIDKIESANNKTGTISASSTDTQYPTALAAHNALTPKEDAANKVTADAWEANKDSDVKYPTCKAVADAAADIYAEVEYPANRVTTISLLSTDDEYPTVKAVVDIILRRMTSIAHG
ncbi:hypothetical protein NO2_1589 [Candidatus Termititenax persephonae]|uniref:Uncharacterized protein n=1 Tax=Candidatus Termititenax persephonae TaxID=2218525 RepID=A0A388TIS1_9BACT|nr:hypothetical protein NO2_1589 [Candidatus Termititenax persephonae]